MQKLSKVTKNSEKNLKLAKSSHTGQNMLVTTRTPQVNSGVRNGKKTQLKKFKSIPTSVYRQTSHSSVRNETTYKTTRIKENKQILQYNSDKNKKKFCKPAQEDVNLHYSKSDRLASQTKYSFLSGDLNGKNTPQNLISQPNITLVNIFDRTKELLGACLERQKKWEKHCSDLQNKLDEYKKKYQSKLSTGSSQDYNKISP